MDLLHLLPTIQSLRDLGRLVLALDFEPLWDEVPSEAGLRLRGHCGPTGEQSPIMVVGRVGDFPWFAIEDTDAPARAHALARRIAARGRVGGLFVLDPHARRLAASVAFGAFPVLSLALDAPDPAAAAALERLTPFRGSDTPEEDRLGYAARVADALSAERVGFRFFRQFRATLAAMASGLPRAIRAEHRHDFALLQLTRVLFLYFVQTKGWLAGRDRFLGEQVDRCLTRGRRVHRDLLRPLFFGTLNRPTGERTRTAAAFGAIPFLNGGLFEPHPLERRYRADVPNHLWRDAFDRLFEAFHFTIAERDRRGTVAPDMLGRVFEGVMDPQRRRSTGTFYTPAPLVDRLLEASFVALLANRLACPEEAAERRLRDGEPEAAATLDAITLLDPAVGSGAFLLGALELLAGLRTGPSAARKRQILQRNLFGVDRSATAVRLTELRLWLAVIADDPAEDACGVAPLPNLDCLVRQGDSLFDPIRPSPDADRRLAARAADLATLRGRVVTAVGPTKSALVRQLRAAELELLAISLRGNEVRVRAEIAHCLREARGPDLFGSRRGLDRALRTNLRQLRTALRETRRARRLVSDGEIPWFPYQSHFADVFARGGFDLVVGNPPWQRAETIPSATRQHLAGRYRWWRARGGGAGQHGERGKKGYGHSPDLAVAFLERAFELVAPGGVAALLIPAKLTSAGYGTRARHALAAETTLHVVANLTDDSQAGFDATVYPLAIVASRSSPSPRHRVRTMLTSRGPTVRQADLTGGGPWLFVAERHRRALEALRAGHPRLEDRFTCHLGVKTGANPLFLHPPADVEPEVIRRAVRGRDVAAFRVTASSRLLWTHAPNGQPCPTLPPRAAAYLAPHHAALRARADFVRGGVPWTLFRIEAAIAPHRVVWADLGRRLTAAALVGARDRDCIPLNTCYVAATDSASEAERLAAWLNSTWIRVAARAAAPPASGGFARFNATVVGALPLPSAALHDPELSTLARAGRAGAEVQESLDAVVARHLDLSDRAQAALRSLSGARSHDRR